MYYIYHSRVICRLNARSEGPEMGLFIMLNDTELSSPPWDQLSYQSWSVVTERLDYLTLRLPSRIVSEVKGSRQLKAACVNKYGDENLDIYLQDIDSLWDAIAYPSLNRDVGLVNICLWKKRWDSRYAWPVTHASDWPGKYNQHLAIKKHDLHAWHCAQKVLMKRCCHIILALFIYPTPSPTLKLVIKDWVFNLEMTFQYVPSAMAFTAT